MHSRCPFGRVAKNSLGKIRLSFKMIDEILGGIITWSSHVTALFT